MSFNLRIHEDVVDVQLNKVNAWRYNSRVVSKHGRERHVLVVLSNASTGRSTTNSIGSLNSELQIEIARGDKENLVRVLNVDIDETLTVGDRDGGNREPEVSVEPENHLKPVYFHKLCSSGLSAALICKYAFA